MSKEEKRTQDLLNTKGSKEELIKTQEQLAVNLRKEKKENELKRKRKVEVLEIQELID